jgi:hypothetical protein
LPVEPCDGAWLVAVWLAADVITLLTAPPAPADVAR